MEKPTPSLPFAPIARFTALAGGLAELTAGLPEPDAHRLSLAYHRGRESGTVTLWAADRLCVEVLGQHPMLVFGDDWLQALEGTCDGRPDHDPGAGKEASNSAYSRGCRCTGCTRAHAEYAQSLAIRRRQVPART